MTLTNTELKQLSAGVKLKKKAVAGKNIGGMIGLDFLAAASAVVISSAKDGISVSMAYTKLLEAEIAKKYGKNVSRGMIGARMNKLWEIGFCQKRQEMVEREGYDPYPRNIYYLGDPEATPIQSRLHLEGKYSKKCYDVIFKDTYKRVKPDNNFEEAIFDLISDTSECSFPIEFSEYRKYVVEQFRKELSREHRLIQLKKWIHEAYPSAAAMNESDTDIEFIVYFANTYSKNVWGFVQNQLGVLQKLAKVREVLPFNEDEYKRLTNLDPDYHTPHKELKERKKTTRAHTTKGEFKL